VSDKGRQPAGLAACAPASCDLTLGMTCIDQSHPGEAVWVMTAAEHLANPVGMVQGGLLTAFAVAAMSGAVGNRRGRQTHAAGSELKISFIKGATVGETLTCRARVIGGGRRVAFVEAEISDSSNGLVAKASSTYLLDRGG
jgi:uncharacterized protein (TIGR00369 family)